MILVLALLIILQGVLFNSILDYANFTIANVILSPDHAKSEEVQVIQAKGRKILLYLTLGFLTLLLLFPLILPPNRKETFSILALAAYPILAIISLESRRGQLIKLKKAKQWNYDDSKRSVSLKVSAETGHAAPSILWQMPIGILSLLPLAYLLIKGILKPEIHFLFLIMPIISLLLIVTYPRILRVKSMASSPKEEADLAYHRNMERINGWTYILVHFITVVFSYLLVLSTLQILPLYWTPFSLLGLILAILGLFLWSRKKRQELVDPIVHSNQWQLAESTHYNRWGFYNNPRDPRLMVPKQNPGMGLTINLGHKAGKIMSLATLVVPLIILALVIYISNQGFQITTEDKLLEIHAPLYGQTIEYDHIESVTLSNENLNSFRTNGYGGFEKAFGYFQDTNYGSILLYHHKSNPVKIILRVKNEARPIIIFNEKSDEATQALFKKIQQAMKPKEGS